MMVDGLNFKDFVAFLLAFSAKASMKQKIECMLYMHRKYIQNSLVTYPL